MITPFAIGHVLSALLIGALGGLFVSTASIVSFAIAMGFGALASVVICRIFPGEDGPGWQLWIVGSLFNPLLLVALFFTADASDCMFGKVKGAACLFDDIGPLVVAVCLLPPLIGIGVRWLLRSPPPPVPPE